MAPDSDAQQQQAAPVAAPSTGSDSHQPAVASGPRTDTVAATLPDADAHSAGKPDNARADAGRGRRGRGGGGGGGRGHGVKGQGDRKRKDLGRNEYNRERVGKRGRNNEWEDRKRQKVTDDGAEGAEGADAAAARPSYMSIPFSETEIAAEERRPKRKVAVMIGYAGTGYRGLQINHREKTIEGELFGAFVAARAISKVNADDPKKSSLVRCARTDKGVHAAGNVLSLKLIIEDEDVVQKINDALPPQIRVWGIQRTNNSFSCYQTCDSRWYEYLMPSYCLLPPHPESFMGKKVLEAVEEKGIEEEYAQRLGALRHFWDEVEKNEIQPILDGLDPEVREKVIQRRYLANNATPPQPNGEAKAETQGASETEASLGEGVITMTPDAAATAVGVPDAEAGGSEDPSATPMEISTNGAAPGPQASEDGAPNPKEQDPVDVALKQIKTAYVAAKRRYRVTPDRIERLQEALNQYVGTRNYHNYTIQKSPTDASAKRNIKSFVVNPQPIQINDTEWLSLKVHGQSFMMHQIRKMVGMAVLVTRCGTNMSRIQESYAPTRISIPKAPSLGLLLERPVFENYNKRAEGNYERPAIDFANYEKEIQAFKDAHIYQHIFALEEKENSFHTFFHQIDSFRSDYFLWVTAGGIGAAHKRLGQRDDDVPQGMDAESDNEAEDPEGGEG